MRVSDDWGKQAAQSSRHCLLAEYVLLFLLSLGTHAPSPRVRVTLHDAPLDLGDDAVVARGKVDRRHEGDAEGDGLTLGRHEDDLLADLDVGLVAKKTRDHELGTVADGIDGRVLDDKPLVAGQERLERADDPPEVRLVARVVVDPLGVKDVVHADDVVVLAHRPRPNTPKLLHVAANAEEQAEVDAERPDVGSGLARDVEDGETASVVKLNERRRVDRPDSELTLNGRDERRPLEQGTSEGLKRPGKDLLVLERRVQPENGDILLSGGLLRLDKPRRPVDADDEAAGDLGVERARVTRLFNPKNPPEPGDNLVRRRVRRLVEVDDARLDVSREVTLERAASL